MALKSVWGIDIGKFSIKAVRLDRRKGGIEVGATDIIPFRTLPLFDPEARWDDLVIESLRDLYFRQRIGESPVFVSLTGHQIFNRTIEITATDPKRLPELVKHEAKQQIPGDIDDVIWKYEDISPPGAVEREVVLFALRRDVVEGLMQTLRAAQVNPIGLTVAPLSVYNFLAYDRAPNEPLVALDIGSDSTDLLVIDRKKVWIRPLRSAGNDFTKAIRDASGLDLSESERLKRQIGRHDKRDALLKALDPLYNEVVAEVQRSLGFYKQQAEENVEFAKLLVLGGGTRIPNFNRTLGRGLQMEVESLTELRKLRVGPKTDANLFNTNLPVLGSALGLALQGLEATTYRINLLPERYAHGMVLDSKKSWVISAGLVTLAAGAVLLGSLKLAEKGLDAANREATELEGTIRTQTAALEAARDHSEADAENAYYKSVLRNRKEVMDVAHAIYALIPAANDENPYDKAGKIDASITEARLGLSKLHLQVLAPIQITEDKAIEGSEPPETEKVNYLVTRIQVIVGAWYHKPKTGQPNGTYDKFKANLEAAIPGLVADDSGLSKPPELKTAPGTDGEVDKNGTFVEFVQAYTLEIQREQVGK